MEKYALLSSEKFLWQLTQEASFWRHEALHSPGIQNYVVICHAGTGKVYDRVTFVEPIANIFFDNVLNRYHQWPDTVQLAEIDQNKIVYFESYAGINRTLRFQSKILGLSSAERARVEDIFIARYGEKPEMFHEGYNPHDIESPGFLEPFMGKGKPYGDGRLEAERCMEQGVKSFAARMQKQVGAIVNPRLPSR